MFYLLYHPKEGSINFEFTSYTLDATQLTYDKYIQSVNILKISAVTVASPYKQQLAHYTYSCIFDVIMLLLANSIQFEYIRIRYDDEIKILVYIYLRLEKIEMRINSISFLCSIFIMYKTIILHIEHH